ncbi:MAG: SoxR reducing system RseC family protein [Candidatus Freyarchaeota archaeon]
MRKIDTSMILYPILMVFAYALSRYPLLSGYLGNFVMSIEVLLLSLFFSQLSLLIPNYGKVVSKLFKGVGFALALYFFPFELYVSLKFHVPLALLVAGVTIASVASELPELLGLLSRGFGLAIVFYSIYLFSRQLVNGYIIAPAFLYATVASMVVYILVAVERSGLIGSRFVERNATGIILLFILLGLYVGLRPYILENYPRYVFYLEWGTLGLATLLAAIAVQNHLSTTNLENYLVGEWKKHSIEISIVGDEEFEHVKKAVEDFVVRKKKSSLVKLLTYYGIKALGDIEAVEELIEPIVEYEEDCYSVFTPNWLVKKRERERLQRRLQLVKSAIKKIEDYMGDKR